jgi:hypothetical protein
MRPAMMFDALFLPIAAADILTLTGMAGTGGTDELGVLL